MHVQYIELTEEQKRILAQAAPLVVEEHESKARDIGVQARSYVVTGSKATVRGAQVTGQVVRGFLSGLLKGK